jgi:hypothetical protein
MSEKEQNYLTKTDLAEFTEDVLLPAVEKIVDDKLEEKLNVKFGEFRHELKDYIDDKTSDLKGEMAIMKKDLVVVINDVKEKDKGFKIKLANMMKLNKINDRKEIAALEILI